MKKKFWPFLLTMLALTACSKQEQMRPAEGLEVKIVVASGWCGNVKSIVINKNQTNRDLRGNSCERSTINSITNTNESTFLRLNNYLTELDLFDRTIQECARCSDGVDYMLEINDGTSVVKQSIGFQNKEAGMQDFLNFLEEL